MNGVDLYSVHRLIYSAQSISTRMKCMVGARDGVDVNSIKKGYIDYYWLFHTLYGYYPFGQLFLCYMVTAGKPLPPRSGAQLRQEIWTVGAWVRLLWAQWRRSRDLTRKTCRSHVVCI